MKKTCLCRQAGPTAACWEWGGAKRQHQRGLTEKAKASLKNSDLLQKFKEIDALPEDEQSVIVKVIAAYVRDFRAKQAYGS